MSVLTFRETPGRTAFVNNDEYLFFSGYAYLGMRHLPDFIALVKEGIDQYGWLFPSSRISNTRLKLYGECEALLCEITGCEETVLVPSGFTAGRIAIEKFGEEVINLKPSHPAIAALSNEDASERKGHVFAVDSVDPLTATITDFSFIEKDDPAKTVIVDDSHGMGLIGRNGKGINAFLPKNSWTTYVITYSLSKSLNVIAGAVSCKKELAGELRRMPQYTASTAPSPALLHAFLRGQHLYDMQRERLKDNVIYFQSMIRELKEIRFSPALPIFILPPCDEEELLKKKIIISSFAYPDPSGQKLQRVVLNALHTRNDLEILAEALHEVL